MAEGKAGLRQASQAVAAVAGAVVADNYQVVEVQAAPGWAVLSGLAQGAAEAQVVVAVVGQLSIKVRPPQMVEQVVVAELEVGVDKVVDRMLAAEGAAAGGEPAVVLARDQVEVAAVLVEEP
jgi:hypothetical protein